MKSINYHKQTRLFFWRVLSFKIMTGIDESDITTLQPTARANLSSWNGVSSFRRNTELECGSDASILTLDSVDIRAQLMEMADEENAGNRSEEMSPLSARDIKHSSLSTNPSITLLENTSVSLAHNIDNPFAHRVPAAISASTTVPLRIIHLVFRFLTLWMSLSRATRPHIQSDFALAAVVLKRACEEHWTSLRSH